MRQELEPSTIVQTSDFSGFAGLRVVIRQKQDGTYGSGRRGTPFFLIGYRPGDERGRVTLRFRAGPVTDFRLTRESVVIPAGQPFESDYVDA